MSFNDLPYMPSVEEVPRSIYGRVAELEASVSDLQLNVTELEVVVGGLLGEVEKMAALIKALATYR